VGLEKKVSKYNLDVRNSFPRSHTGRWWRCSKDGTVKCQVGEVLGAKCKTFQKICNTYNSKLIFEVCTLRSIKSNFGEMENG